MLPRLPRECIANRAIKRYCTRSEEHTSELQSRLHLVCRLLPEKKKPRFAVRVLAVIRQVKAGALEQQTGSARNETHGRLAAYGTGQLRRIVADLTVELFELVAIRAAKFVSWHSAGT